MDYANFFALANQVSYRLFYRFSGGAHNDYNFFGIFGTAVFEQPVTASGNFGKSVHCFLDNNRDFRVKGINGFSGLEINIRVLSRASNKWVVRVKSTGTVS